MSDDERLPVSLEVMAMMELDFPEAARIFRASPLALNYQNVPHKWVTGLDEATLPGQWLKIAGMPGMRVWVVPQGKNVLEGDIRADERRIVCGEEGHRWIAATDLVSPVVLLQCGRCARQWEAVRDQLSGTPWVDATDFERNRDALAAIAQHMEVTEPKREAGFFARVLLRTLDQIRKERQ